VVYIAYIVFGNVAVGYCPRFGGLVVVVDAASTGSSSVPLRSRAAMLTCGCALPMVCKMAPPRQGLTLVHFSAQLEPCLTHENTLHTLNTP